MLLLVTCEGEIAGHVEFFRPVSYRDAFELALRLPDVVATQTRQPSLEGTGEVRLRRLVKEALRMRPDRIEG